MLRISHDPNPTRDQVAAVRQGLRNYNLAQVPQLASAPSHEFALVVRKDGEIVGGALAELDWDWLYIDTLWVSDALRGQGYGQQIMLAAESYAAQQGITHCYLFTSSFQARPFYERIGYTLFGEQADRPRGHTIYYLRKEGLEEQPIADDLEALPDPPPSIVTALNEGLLAHAAEHVSLRFQPLAVFAYDEQNRLQGGAYGNAYWDWLDLRYLWLDEAWHGQGYGAALLNEVERVARSRNLLGIFADTTSFQAWPFYQAQGFRLVAQLPDRPIGHQTYFIEKRFV